MNAVWAPAGADEAAGERWPAAACARRNGVIADVRTER